MANKYPSQQQGGTGLPVTFLPFAAGNRHYGTGRSAPNIGKTANKAGYGERDAKAAARRAALFRRAGGQ